MENYNMNYNIYIPDSVIYIKKQTRFFGFITITERKVDIYVYIFNENNVDMSNLLDCNTQTCFEGILAEYDNTKNIDNARENFLILSIAEKYPQIVFLKVGNVVNLAAPDANVIILLYNYDTLLKSEGFSTQDYQNKYAVLSNKIKVHNMRSHLEDGCENNQYRCEKLSSFVNALIALFMVSCEHSTFCCHIKSFINYFKWIYNDIKKSRKITIKSGNMMLSIFVDFVLGIILLNWINQWYGNPSEDFMKVIEMIVLNLRKLLEWLMGSPAGLKLNHAFNNTLGKFFLYHIELWWLFIAVATKLNMLDVSLSLFKYIGILGVTFQSAILADFLTLASLHVYCIYVYAARLYYMQVTGLVALWRLFLGKKKNPLRGGVDSCQYTHQQLFVGMLAFTILLFLLPTTALYYIVFTLFRICIVIMSGMLSTIRHFVRSLPLYVLFLWLIDSPKIASNVQISVLKSEKTPEVVLGVTFTSNPLSQLIDHYRPETIMKPTPIEWVKLISSLWMGELIYPV